VILVNAVKKVMPKQIAVAIPINVNARKAAPAVIVVKTLTAAK
jgi:hypothetical protein